ncbi:Clcn3, partial [Symbiodinium sp. KB8]
DTVKPELLQEDNPRALIINVHLFKAPDFDETELAQKIKKRMAFLGETYGSRDYDKILPLLSDFTYPTGGAEGMEQIKAGYQKALDNASDNFWDLARLQPSWNFAKLTPIFSSMQEWPLQSPPVVLAASDQAPLVVVGEAMQRLQQIMPGEGVATVISELLSSLLPVGVADHSSLQDITDEFPVLHTLGVSSNFPSRTLLMAFVSSVVATLLLSVSDLTGTGHLTLYSVRYTMTLHPSDYVMFAVLGVAGGLVGALFNALNIRWCAFKAKPAFKRWLGPVQEASVLAFVTLVSSWPLSLTRYLMAPTIHALFDTCSDEPGETVRSRLQAEFGLCTEDGYSNSSGNGLLTSLGLAAALRFCQMVFTIGSACPAGLFVPSLFVGACLGRCLALGLKALNAGTRLFPNKVDPGVYSMVGAASVLGGVSRMTISLVVIMLELTGGLDYVVPFMISVLLAKAVGDSLNEGIYDLQIVLKGYPFLHEELDVTFTERCCDIMETGLVKLDVKLRPRFLDIRVMVRAFTFRGFPVVDGDRFVGYIRRSALEDWLSRMELVRGQNEVVALEDLASVIDSTVMRMVPDAPLTQAHQVFKQLGCQRIFIVGSVPGGQQDLLRGILTKKSFLKFLQDGTVGCMPDVLQYSTLERNGNLRFAYEGPQQESTASHIRVGEIFSVLSAAAEAGEESRPDDCASHASQGASASDAEETPICVNAPELQECIAGPFHRFYAPDSEHHCFQEMFEESYVAKATQDRPCPKGTCGKTPGGCPCNQPGADPGLPVSFNVQRVIRVESSELWERYQNKKKAIMASRPGGVEEFDPPVKTMNKASEYTGTFAPVDGSINEVYAFHGTQVRYALAIAENAFRIDLAGSSTGTLYGRGAYLGESISKADEYAKDEPGGFYDGVFAVLVCRVVMGKLNCTKSDAKAAEKVSAGQFDSTCGTRVFRELVIYDADQCYPEYLVLYKRKYAKDPEEETTKPRKRRFFMQVPLHWRNVATDLSAGFREEVDLKGPATAWMQCLVNQAQLVPARTILQATRLEDSTIWERYVQFKAALRSRIDDRSGDPLRLTLVEKDLRALMKRPCKFFKTPRGCKSGDKCRFSHNEFGLDLDDLGLAAGRRLPVDELDRRLHEGFLWYACTRSAASELSQGHVKKDATLPGTRFYESLQTALKQTKAEDGMKVAVLCRVMCGLPGVDVADDNTDFMIIETDANGRREVLVKDGSAVYPEYHLCLSYSDEEEVEKMIESMDRSPKGKDGDEPRLAVDDPTEEPGEKGMLCCAVAE